MLLSQYLIENVTGIMQYSSKLWTDASVVAVWLSWVIFRAHLIWRSCFIGQTPYHIKRWATTQTYATEPSTWRVCAYFDSLGVNGEREEIKEKWSQSGDRKKRKNRKSKKIVWLGETTKTTGIKGETCVFTWLRISKFIYIVIAIFLINITYCQYRALIVKMQQRASFSPFFTFNHNFVLIGRIGS